MRVTPPPHLSEGAVQVPRGVRLGQAPGCTVAAGIPAVVDDGNGCPLPLNSRVSLAHPPPLSQLKPLEKTPSTLFPRGRVGPGRRRQPCAVPDPSPRHGDANPPSERVPSRVRTQSLEKGMSE